MTRYRIQLGGQLGPDVLLVRLMHEPGRPLVHVHLPSPVTGLAELWPLTAEAEVVSHDAPAPYMYGDLELPDGRMLTQVASAHGG